jgi:hypothetical protein
MALAEDTSAKGTRKPCEMHRSKVIRPSSIHNTCTKRKRELAALHPMERTGIAHRSHREVLSSIQRGMVHMYKCVCVSGESVILLPLVRPTWAHSQKKGSVHGCLHHRV